MSEPKASKREFTDAERADIFARYTANPKSGKELAAEFQVSPAVIRGLIYRERQRRASLSAGGHAPAGSDPEAVGPGSASVAYVKLSPLECLEDLLSVFTAKAKASRKSHMATRDTGTFIREVVAGIIALEERRAITVDATPTLTKSALSRLTPEELLQYAELQRRIVGGEPIALAYDPSNPQVYDPERRDDSESSGPGPSTPSPGG